MRIALLYPPPWKIPVQGQPPDPIDGPPPGHRPGDLDADFYQTPYGLFAIGAQAIRAGHQVKIFNLSSFSWTRVEEVLSKLDADIYGMSCWTANRRGVGLVADRIKKLRPKAHVAVGGPHATPFAKEMLEHHKSIDTVCMGESDITFLELCDRVAVGRSTEGMLGAAYRSKGRAVVGPARAAVENLDSLACPQDYFDTHILMTSRGCPWQCTFCGAETTWGRGFRSNSVDATLDALQKVLSRLPVKMIQVKDDTFTTNKKRVMELCKKIQERKMQFFWSCDTRVDLLTEPLLREMRLAGCERLSLGVESGSQRILNAIDKKITVAEIEQSTELAKKVGIKVRYYMMLGNRGDDRESFQETLRFLERSKPHEYIFSCLSIYPGTRDFDDAEAAGWLNREVYFKEKFQEYKTPYDSSDEDMAIMNAWFVNNSGLRTVYREGVEDYRRILAELGDYHAAHMDLGGALFHAGDLDGAEKHVRRALELGYPLPGLVYNYLACISKQRGDLESMMDWFTLAAREDPQHFVLIQNVNAARAWFAAGGAKAGAPLNLAARHDFQLLERTVQPTLPGPLPDGFEVWSGEVMKPLAGGVVKSPEVEGSTHELRVRLRVVG
jgi:radical SAM superfamily enzyme YgiQ (UPF0313 family)